MKIWIIILCIIPIWIISFMVWTWYWVYIQAVEPKYELLKKWVLNDCELNLSYITCKTINNHSKNKNNNKLLYKKWKEK